MLRLPNSHSVNKSPASWKTSPFPIWHHLKPFHHRVRRSQGQAASKEPGRGRGSDMIITLKSHEVREELNHVHTHAHTHGWDLSEAWDIWPGKGFNLQLKNSDVWSGLSCLLPYGPQEKPSARLLVSPPHPSMKALTAQLCFIKVRYVIHWQSLCFFSQVSQESNQVRIFIALCFSAKMCLLVA